MTVADSIQTLTALPGADEELRSKRRTDVSIAHLATTREEHVPSRGAAELDDRKMSAFSKVSDRRLEPPAQAALEPSGTGFRPDWIAHARLEHWPLPCRHQPVTHLGGRSSAKRSMDAKIVVPGDVRVELALEGDEAHRHDDSPKALASSCAKTAR
jgi:hypothetical protein